MFKSSQKIAAVSMLVLLAACTPEYCEDTTPAAAPAVALPYVAPATPMPAPVLAQSVPVAKKPLAVIRFGQNKDANYRYVLKDALKKAEEAKPGVEYDVVSYVPTVGNVAKDQREANTALRNQQGVTQEMFKLGVNPNRIIVRSVYTPIGQMQEQEVHVYIH